MRYGSVFGYYKIVRVSEAVIRKHDSYELTRHDPTAWARITPRRGGLVGDL